MKKGILKSTVFASLILISLTCFIYVNTACINRTLCVETITHPTKSDAEKAETDSKMPDLVLVKGVLTIIQNFLPAK